MLAYRAAGSPYTQCLAYSADGGRTFVKYARNPVLPHVAGENRDPKVFWHAATKRWIMALYEVGSTYGFFSSSDLKTWTLLSDLTVPGCSECPDLFELPLDGNATKPAWVMVFGNGKYIVGRFDGKSFTSSRAAPTEADCAKNISGWNSYMGPNNYRPPCYAAQTFNNVPREDGRRIQIAWMRQRPGRHAVQPANDFSPGVDAQDHRGGSAAVLQSGPRNRASPPENEDLDRPRPQAGR